jgi:hypothetical protein
MLAELRSSLPNFIEASPDSTVKISPLIHQHGRGLTSMLIGASEKTENGHQSAQNNGLAFRLAGLLNSHLDCSAREFRR